MTTDEMRIAIAEHLGWRPDTRSSYFINESKREITPECREPITRGKWCSGECKDADLKDPTRRMRKE